MQDSELRWKCPQVKRGAGLIEMLLGLAVLAAIVAGGFWLAQNGQAIAQWLQQVTVTIGDSHFWYSHSFIYFSGLHMQPVMICIIFISLFYVYGWYEGCPEDAMREDPYGWDPEYYLPLMLPTSPDVNTEQETFASGDADNVEMRVSELWDDIFKKYIEPYSGAMASMDDLSSRDLHYVIAMIMHAPELDESKERYLIEQLINFISNLLLKNKRDEVFQQLGLLSCGVCGGLVAKRAAAVAKGLQGIGSKRKHIRTVCEPDRAASAASDLHLVQNQSGTCPKGEEATWAAASGIGYYNGPVSYGGGEPRISLRHRVFTGELENYININPASLRRMIAALRPEGLSESQQNELNCFINEVFPILVALRQYYENNFDSPCGCIELSSAAAIACNELGFKTHMAFNNNSGQWHFCAAVEITGIRFYLDILGEYAEYLAAHLEYGGKFPKCGILMLPYDSPREPKFRQPLELYRYMDLLLFSYGSSINCPEARIEIKAGAIGHTSQHYFMSEQV
ncbi:MAG: hypothetical protein NTY47_00060, partial [Candidatus Omnitrophica bacterium]|nr:hypothetical protein [Candidatus Omnitrophota bacterium]